MNRPSPLRLANLDSCPFRRALVFARLRRMAARCAGLRSACSRSGDTARMIYAPTAAWARGDAVEYDFPGGSMNRRSGVSGPSITTPDGHVAVAQQD